MAGEVGFFGLQSFKPRSIKGVDGANWMDWTGPMHPDNLPGALPERRQVWSGAVD